MTSNQLPVGMDLSKIRGANQMGLAREQLPETGFGLGVSVALAPSRGNAFRDRDGGAPSDYNPLGCGVGEFGWGGAANTHFFAFPKDGGLLVLFFTQVLRDPTSRFIARELRRHVYSSVLEPQ